jgi:hypothetical protein
MAGDRRRAERDARELARQAMPSGRAVAGLVQAGLARVAGDSSKARRRYLDAARELDRLDMRLMAAAARFRAALLAGEKDDRAYFALQGILRPEAMVDAVAP